MRRAPVFASVALALVPAASAAGPGALLPSVSGPSAASHRQPGYGAVAAKLSHGAAQAVDCWSRGDWARLTAGQGVQAGYKRLGFVDKGAAPGDVELSPEVCSQLDTLRYGRTRPRATLGLANAVDVLAHETFHTAGVSDEAATECYAIQSVAWVARQLGAPWRYAHLLAEREWADYSDEPAGYTSPECRNGGKLDLRPASHSWP
ncbi:MAG TPA: hypothetical protein VGF23_26015 [Gaiellaceae bacterium]